MMRFAWLQSRSQNLVALSCLMVAAAGLAVTRPHLIHLYDTIVATCTAQGDCETAIPAFLHHDNNLRTWLGFLVMLTPALIGIFWGAPLVAREIESGTYRLIWTQSITRGRWLAVKLGVVGIASVATAGLLSLVVTWWARPLDRAGMHQFATFDQRDLAPLGYAAFAFIVGVVAGLLIRRTLPAMAVALVAFAGARLAVTRWVRPHLLAHTDTNLPIQAASHMHFGLGSTGGTFAVVGNPSIPNAWVLSSRLVDKAGHAATPEALHRFIQHTCPVLAAQAQANGGSRVRPPDPTLTRQCLGQLSANFHLAVTYQPASHYWPLQWYETAIFLGAALILAAFCLFWVRRRHP
jgi:hypothetical protein